MIRKPRVEFIFTDDQLANAAQLCRQAPRVGFDTEFERRNTYLPKLALLQLAVDNTKMLHAPLEDLELCYHLWQCAPVNVVDTQVAMGLAGKDFPSGYQKMVDTLLGVQIAKEANHTDWFKRPLSDAQIEYAAEDVLYLGDCLDALTPALTELGRLDWLYQHGEFQVTSARFDSDPVTAYRRLSNVWRMKPREKFIAIALTHWQEETAWKKNRPRNHILPNKAITPIAENAPRSKKQLATIKVLPPRNIDRYGEQILACVQEGLTNADAINRDQFFAEQRATLAMHQSIKSLCNDLAKTLDIPSALLMSRRTIADVADHLLHGKPEMPFVESLIGQWQTAVCFESLRRLTEGDPA